MLNDQLKIIQQSLITSYKAWYLTLPILLIETGYMLSGVMSKSIVKFFPLFIIFYFFISIYFLSGLYSLISDHIQIKPITLKQYFSASKNFAVPYFWTIAAIMAVSLIFSIPYFIYSKLYLNVSPVVINDSAPGYSLLTILSMFVSGLTVYTIPSLFIKGMSGFNAIRYSILFLIKHIKESIMLFYLILISYIFSTLTHQFFQHLAGSNKYWLISLFNHIIVNYFEIIIFLTAIQIIKNFKIDFRIKLTGLDGEKTETTRQV